MNQVLSIRFAQDASPQAAAFLRAWEQVGAWSRIAGQGYELRSRSGDNMLLTCVGAELQITGCTQDDSHSFIKAFAASSGGELLYEGELLGKSEVVPSKVIEGEFIRGEGQHAEPMRGWGTHGGQTVFRQLKLKPIPKAVIIPAVLIFFPIALAVMLLLMMLIFGKLAIHLMRFQKRG